MEFRKCLSQHDVLMVPRYSGLEHRSDANIEMRFDNIPKPFTTNVVINSPMIAVQSKELLEYLHNDMNSIVTIHRYYKSAQEMIDFCKSCDFKGEDYRRVFLSVGSVYKWKEFIDEVMDYCKETGASILIDMANGDTKSCIDTVKYCKEHMPENNIMAGNVATKSGYERLANAGASFVRVGIGGGCFPGNIKVLTTDGYENIENIKIGDEVFTHMGRPKKVVDKLYKGQNGEMIKINNLMSTKNHPYYVLHKKYKDVVNDNNIEEYAEWIAADDITEDYYLLELNKLSV